MASCDLLAIAGNTRLYGGVAHLTADARADDGQLDLALFEARAGWAGVLDRARHSVQIVRHMHSGVAYERTRHVRITPERALPVQIDGEYLGMCGADAPLELTVEPLAIRLLIASDSSPLFTRGV